jgi:hypothetical protein
VLLKQFQQKCAAVLRPELRQTRRQSIPAIPRKAEMLWISLGLGPVAIGRPLPPEFSALLP